MIQKMHALSLNRLPRILTLKIIKTKNIQRNPYIYKDVSALELQDRTWTCGSVSGFKQRYNNGGLHLPSDLCTCEVRIPALHKAHTFCKENRRWSI